MKIHTESVSELPYFYEESKVVLMARDPHCLFAYWEISEANKNSFISNLSTDVWEKSLLELKITNVTENTSLFIPVNEFSSSMYINVSEPNCLYTAELGRKLPDNLFINMMESNYVHTPSDKASVNYTALFADYKNIKAGQFNYIPTDISKMQAIKLYQPEFGMSSQELVHALGKEGGIENSSSSFSVEYFNKNS